MQFKQLFNELKENVEKTANIKAIFGKASEFDKIKIIPVAALKVRGGGGGGTGTARGKKDSEKSKENQLDKENQKKPAAKGQGGGLGMDIQVNPVGYIKIEDNDAEFVEIIDKTKLMMNGLKVLVILIITSTIKYIFSNFKKGKK